MSLIKRLEEARVPLLELDSAIAIAVGHDPIDIVYDGAGEIPIYSSYTNSIDAALTLVPNGWMLTHLSEIGADGLDLAVLGNPGEQPSLQANGIPFGMKADGVAGMAVAICIAALKARGIE